MVLKEGHNKPGYAIFASKMAAFLKGETRKGGINTFSILVPFTSLVSLNEEAYLP
jgi:hypothetical protein